MNIYTTSTGCYSDYDETILIHEKMFTPDEFKEICAEVIKKVRLANDENIDNYIFRDECAIEILVKQYGFKEAEYLNCHLHDYIYGELELPHINNFRIKEFEDK
jgi:hypothetical protein